jgi:hypothetical protein
MAGRRHDDGQLCLCDRPDGSCAGLVVRRLSRDRVRELAEEIWAASLGDLLPAGPVPDPRSSRAGASAQAAYRRRREQERQGWRLDWAWWSLAVLGAATAGLWLVGATVGDWLAGPAALLAAVLTGWRLRFRLSLEATICKRLAAMQRRTARVLAPLADEGWLVLHDLTLPGWLDSLDHLAVGPTGVWVVSSWRRPRRLLGGTAPVEVLHGLRSQAERVAEVLDGWGQVPVRTLLCVHGAWSGTGRMLHDVRVTAPRQLADAIQGDAPLPPGEFERATARLLQVLRPAA